MTSWVEKLAGAVAPTSVTDILVEAVYARFSGYDEDTLAAAVDMYLEEGEYFPTIARFKPYAETAAHLANTKTIRRVHRYSDEEMYQWERDRGTMRPLSVIDAEIADARQQVKGR